jgi:hypothetical protein
MVKQCAESHAFYCTPHLYHLPRDLETKADVLGTALLVNDAIVTCAIQLVEASDETVYLHDFYFSSGTSFIPNSQHAFLAFKLLSPCVIYFSSS